MSKRSLQNNLLSFLKKRIFIYNLKIKLPLNLLEEFEIYNVDNFDYRIPKFSNKYLEVIFGDDWSKANLKWRLSNSPTSI